MPRHRLYMEFESQASFPEQENRWVRIRKGTRVWAELAMSRVYASKDFDRNDVIEKSFYLGDGSGREYCLASQISAYDIWDMISRCEDAWPEASFKSGYNCISQASLAPVIDGLHFYNDDSGKCRAVRYATPGAKLIDTLVLTEKMFSGSVDVMLQTKRPLPSGTIPSSNFVVVARTDVELQTQGGHRIAAGESMWFRVPCRTLIWQHTMTHDLDDESNGGWLRARSPQPLVFAATGQTVEPLAGVEVG